MTHKLVQIRQTEEFVEWECPECDRHVRLGFDGELLVLTPGDQRANHGSASTVPWLDLDAAMVETPSEADAPAAAERRTIH